MGCGASAQEEEKKTPDNKQKQEFKSLNEETSPTESRDYIPTPVTPEPEVHTEEVPNGTAKNSPGRSPKITPRNSINQKSKISEKSKYTEQEDHSQDTEAHDKGFKKLIRQKLIDATTGNDQQELSKAIDVFERHKLEDCGDLRRAKEKLQYLTLKRDLRDSIRRRHAGVLERTIQDAKHSKFSDKLTNQIHVAEKLLKHLQELNQHSHDICKMEQSTISELRSYIRPPPCVHDVMAATYMMMGYSEDRLGDWNEIQAYLGQLTRDKLIRQVSEFDTKNVNEETATRVKSILEAYTLEEVKDASYGAATFYVWAQNMMDKIDKDKEAEQKQREQEEQQRLAEQQQAEEQQGDDPQQSPRKGGGSVKKKG